MKRYVYWLIVAAALVAASALLYGVHYCLFADWDHIVSYFFIDLAFLPIEVLLVGLIIERLLAYRERRRLLHKMNMLVGMFFSELGTRLLGLLTPCVTNRDAVRAMLSLSADWTPDRFRTALHQAASFDYRVDAARLNLAALRQTLLENRDMLVLLLGNPNLLEHERFTDLLWAVFHLMEELAARPALDGLPPSDLKHLEGDVQRVYGALAVEWLRYGRHLQRAYPYIFSVIVRTHPLQDHPSAIVK
ncbi:MAG: hypothetical protein NTX87_16910 [Planctomycetota bacterium]|nr:hypothetical protein [Planctomycetota bacterium]